MALIFYTNPMSRGQMVRWALHEAGADYEQRLIGYGPEMQGPHYRAINPMGKVPAISDDGAIVTETAAICAYLAARFPAAGLGPASDGERADYYRWLFFAAGPVEQAIIARSMGWTIDDPQKMGMLGFGNFALMLDTLTAKLAADDYVCGARFTAADVYLGGQVTFGLAFGSLPADRPALNDYAARLTARPAYLAAKAIDDALIAAAAPATTEAS